MANTDKNPDDPIVYTRKQVEQWLGRDTVAKALDYVHAVSRLDWAGMQLFAIVKGTQPAPYEVTITFMKGVPHGICSCPVAYRCKHVAAALLANLEYRQRASEMGVRVEVAHWLARLRAKVQKTQASPAAPAAATSATNQIVYALTPSGHAPAMVEVMLLKVRLSRDGEIRAAERWTPNYAAWGNVPKFVTREDGQIIEALRSERSQMGSGYVIAGKKGAAIWQMMLATGRLYYELNAHDVTLETPLREGARRPAQIEWLPADEEKIFASLELEPPAPLVLSTEPPWYVDMHGFETGLIDSPIPDDLLPDYLAIPFLTHEEARIVRASLGEFAPALPAPPESGESSLRIIDTTPTPVLMLDTLELDVPRRLNMPATEVDIAVLAFDYGELTIMANDRGMMFALSDGEVVQIRRHAKLEDASISRLRHAGLGPLTGSHTSAETDLFAGSFMMPDRDAWPAFIHDDVPALRKAGWRVDIVPNSRFDIVEIDTIDGAAHTTDNGWFDLELGIELEQEKVRLEPLLAGLFQRDPRWLMSAAIDKFDDALPLDFRTEAGRRFVIRAGRIKPLVRTLIDLFDGRDLSADAPLRLSALDAGRLAQSDEKLRWTFHGDRSVIELANRLRNVGAPRDIAVPRALKAQLRGYQRDGLNWMQFLREHDLAGVLADDMGLGKTVQTLAHILAEKEAGRLDRPALIVVPTTLVTNWQEEAQRFAPDLKVLDLHGPLRHERFALIGEHDLVLTTYPLVWRDHEALAQHDYHLLILDEAQFVKNASGKAATLIRTLRARHRLCLTGTPLENHLGELWSQFDFLLPGFLGSQKDFAGRWRKPIEKQNDTARRDLLARRVRPFMLRRRKDEVAKELPPKTTIVRSVELEGAQRDLYETVRSAMQKKVRDAIASQGFARSHILMLDALLKLRQVCCDPSLVKLDAAKKLAESAKLGLLLQMLPELIDEGRRVLVFSQFTGMLAIIAAALDAAGIAYVTLTGDTTDRKTPVKRFQAGEAPVFLISLKAGGVGLNLTAADTVIHYDPWWNPAAESQATDRAHRIGQDKPVFVYKLIVAGSIEEKILEMQARKAALAAGILSEDAGAVAKFSADDIEALLAPIPDDDASARPKRRAVKRLNDTD